MLWLFYDCLVPFGAMEHAQSRPPCAPCLVIVIAVLEEASPKESKSSKAGAPVYHQACCQTTIPQMKASAA